MQINNKKVQTFKKMPAFNLSDLNEKILSKDYVDFLNDAGWILEKKLPSNSNNYSDLLEDTEWNYKHCKIEQSRHYRRDLDVLS
tara:strand:- start:355 stop:606 length:252 start_codon:yes stop_codon:yes gene_type:complete